jgi:putative DNA primase/helicase
LVAAVTGDSHRNAEVRQALQPLVDLAADRGIAVLGVSHFSKGTQGRDTVERVNGSIGFGALARVVLATAKTEDGGCILVRAKSNLGPDGGGFGYRLALEDLPGHPGISGTRVLWGHALEGDARALLGEVEQRTDARTATSEAADWLRERLAAGPAKVPDILRDAQAHGFTEQTLQRARKQIGAKV